MEQADLFSPILQRLKGQSDNTILAKLEAAGGVEAALEFVFRGMQDAFRSEKAAGRSLIIHYEIRGPRDVVIYQMDVCDGRCTATRGASRTPDVKLSLSLPNFLRLIMGNLGPAMAYLTGKLRVSGDLLVAAQVEGWFQRPA